MANSENPSVERDRQGAEGIMADPRVRYTAAVLLGQSPEGFNWPAWLAYGPPRCGHRGITIVPSGFFGQSYGTSGALPRLPLSTIAGIPFFFGEARVEEDKGELIISADILASAFFLLTRYEEWVRSGVRDQHGRFPGRESLPFRAGFLNRPVVDEYAVLLRKWASQVGIELRPPKRRFSVLLTHDVDSLGPERGPIQAVRSIAGCLLWRTTLRRALSQTAVACGLRRNAHDNLDDVIRLDQRVSGRFPVDHCRSLFFFMAGGDSPNDGDYRLRSARTLRLLREVKASGAWIGLHTSYLAGADAARMRSERRGLEEATGDIITKNRHHYLRWREPQDGAAIAVAGVRWDSTLGYADVAGFRLGVCHPIPLFDPVRRCLMGIEEHPLIVMDCTLDRPSYMNFGEEAAFECVRALAENTFRHQGEFVCLWHNTVLAANDRSYHRRLYPRVLDCLAELLQTAVNEAV
jgi:hypothetical protein